MRLPALLACALSFLAPVLCPAADLDSYIRETELIVRGTVRDGLTVEGYPRPMLLVELRDTYWGQPQEANMLAVQTPPTGEFFSYTHNELKDGDEGLWLLAQTTPWSGTTLAGRLVRFIAKQELEDSPLLVQQLAQAVIRQDIETNLDAEYKTPRIDPDTHKATLRSATIRLKFAADRQLASIDLVKSTGDLNFDNAVLAAGTYATTRQPNPIFSGQTIELTISH